MERAPHRNQRKPLNWWRVSLAIESVVIDAPGMRWHFCELIGDISRLAQFDGSESGNGYSSNVCFDSCDLKFHWAC
jgi:hypothetical protein